MKETIKEYEFRGKQKFLMIQGFLKLDNACDKETEKFG